ncbi:arginase family protein [Conexibacter arvalis]|uniref:Agmatinase n=1 Tax=Conexibacter arvalis TaxID=912552 RepID=A0A840IBV1_9ACTN|nr:arginase family protein [Conexibacter arvalis]MBB4662172.1 agmatinase [Conexibacter arvalis]
MTTIDTPGFAASRALDRRGLEADVAARRATLARLLRERGLDALVVASEANAHYLTGYETTFFGNRSKPFVVVLLADGTATVVCHVGEATSVELDAIDVAVRPYVGPAVLDADGVQVDYQVPAVEELVALLHERDVAAIGIEEKWHFIPGFTLHAFDRLRLFDGQVSDASGLIWRARRVKSPWELERMRHAAEICEEAHQAFAAQARVGMSERDLGRLLRRCAYDAGAERIGYSGIIAGVDRAPLGGPTDRPWERGQLLFADLCLQIGGGYFADFNRVYASAPPTREQQAAYEQLNVALRRAREVVAAGTPVAELAAALLGEAPSIYARAGHGLGQEMPEPPSLSPHDPTPLRAGEVLCLEPNGEFAGVGWLVGEEEVVVADGGHQPLSVRFPEELRVIGGAAGPARAAGEAQAGAQAGPARAEQPVATAASPSASPFADAQAGRPDLQPLDSAVIPRYAEVATFMRLPRVESLEHVDVGVFGVPFDNATFRGGTREGPAAVREASRAIRRVNPSTGTSPFDLVNVADVGDAPVNVLDVPGSFAAVERYVRELREHGVAPLAVGGDHSTTLPIFRGLRDAAPFGVVQFDSHADIQDRFFGQRDTHASLMRRAVEEGLIDPRRVVQIGLRGTRFGDDDIQYGVDAGFTAITYDEYEEIGRAAVIERIREVIGDAPVYVTYDIDGLDPSHAPGTAAREPGGLSMRDSQVILRSMSGMDVIGGDVCEIAPSLDPTGLTQFSGANLLFEICCLIATARAR